MSFSILFVAGYGCFALAARERLLDSASMQDLKWWAIGIAICTFTSIAALRALRRSPRLGARTRRVRFWLASGALGNLGFGGALAGLTVSAWWDNVLDSTRLAVLFAGAGFALAAFGLYLALHACATRRELDAWLASGLDGPMV
jgi:hypothetical protein